MVHVYNCHPFASQQIVQVEQAPRLVCCGGGALFVVASGRCKVTLHYRQGCPLICRFATMGTVKSISYSKIGDYLVTIEEKNNATYLQAYTNWRNQAEEKARVGVRLLGHLLGGASVRSGVQMEIIEIPLSEHPVAVACCPVTGDLLVGCENSLVLFTLKRQSPVRLKQLTCVVFIVNYPDYETVYLLLGLVPVSFSSNRRFTPEFFHGCSVEETQLHSLQLYPFFTSHQSASVDEPACLFCFFSLPAIGYLYSLKGGVELLSTYEYPEKILEAVLTDHLLHVITRSALQCFTVRCAAVAARIVDPYIDTTMKACPPSSLEVCALRMQLFIGLRSICVCGCHVVLLSTADTDTPEETERSTQSRKWTISSAKETTAVGHGWNLYVVDTVTPLTLYQEMDEYSRQYAENNPQAQSLQHILSEAHLLLRTSLLQTSEQQQKSDEELEEALRQNCAQLGDCFSRARQKDCHLALPYYRMSGLSVTEIITRNRPLPASPHSYGLGFLFYLKHYLLEETEQSLSQETADEVLDIFSQSEPSELISVCASPSMTNISPARTLQILQRLEDTSGVLVPLTITMANMMLRLDDLPQFTQLLDRHAEMLLVYSFIQEPRLLLHAGCGAEHTLIRPTALTHQLVKSHPGLLVAGMVALHENNKIQLEQADHIFKELGCENCLQVDFWEATLMASSQEAVIHELLFRLASIYIDRLTSMTSMTSDTHSSFDHTSPKRRSLKSADDLSLLCGPSLSAGSVLPLLERLPEETLWGFSLHLLCATKRGQYDVCIEKILDRCPQGIIAYANHQLQDKKMVLWWKKLLPELCNRTRAATDNSILLAALKETLVVVAMETSPADFLELIPDDGTAAYFLPHLLTCSQRHLMT
uniref:HPS3 biogenesis of lysosomal organelles complex 2 subunit 1 n=1 Tax=Echeneis naucrates TaxID=173247 RepID=A0A665TJ91_ECHNA